MLWAHASRCLAIQAFCRFQAFCLMVVVRYWRNNPSKSKSCAKSSPKRIPKHTEGQCRSERSTKSWQVKGVNVGSWCNRVDTRAATKPPVAAPGGSEWGINCAQTACSSLKNNAIHTYIYINKYVYIYINKYIYIYIYILNQQPNR